MAHQDAPEETMKQEQMLKDDGRYIVFYSFETEKHSPQGCNKEELRSHDGHEKP